MWSHNQQPKMTANLAWLLTAPWLWWAAFLKWTAARATKRLGATVILLRGVTSSPCLHESFSIFFIDEMFTEAGTFSVCPLSWGTARQTFLEAGCSTGLGWTGWCLTSKGAPTATEYLSLRCACYSKKKSIQDYFSVGIRILRVLYHSRLLSLMGRCVAGAALHFLYAALVGC